MKRRGFVKLAGSGLALWQLPALGLAATKAPAPRPKIVWLLLRGGLDSLHAVVPAFDAGLMQQRRSLAEPLVDKLLPLERGFGLHPDLKFLHGLYVKRQLAPVVAVATPYRSRSHFEGQDVLESGLAPADHDSGWLARALSAYRGEGLAIARSLPIALRGEAAASTWYPDHLPGADSDLYARLLKLYENDVRLHQRLQEALETRAKVGDLAGRRRPRLQHLAKACATLLAAPGGPDCAMLEMGGWDTHNNQPGRLSQQFGQLDAGLQILCEHLGQTWQQTLVVIATEFGRTVKNNGTRGTDHGTASALLLAGGALRGGRVLGEWPGLGEKDLYEGRDLMPTSDMRAWTAALLQQHWQIPQTQLAAVFPGAKPVGLTLTEGVLKPKVKV
ncbi:DUF1501 domain-containing protein [Exilibacterium tricleocarpae]|uniref:DUF1501 domain-containing protein n=1 Tax=Exilibacterium tricleocarpae TaxID=2591008 RepID=A0A545STC9_9GAMM|nr:DUF1501 domain-containing protein [Exilibacterium tricleocarpae]